VSVAADEHGDLRDFSARMPLKMRLAMLRPNSPLVGPIRGRFANERRWVEIYAKPTIDDMVKPLLRNPDARSYEVFVREFEVDADRRRLRSSEMLGGKESRVVHSTLALEHLLSELGVDPAELRLALEVDYPPRD
jgi:hypothetical protein